MGAGMRKNVAGARWTQATLAAAVSAEYNAEADRADHNLTDRAVRNWLNATNRPNPNVFLALCRVLFTPGSPEEAAFRAAWSAGRNGASPEPDVSPDLPPPPATKKYAAADADLPWPDLIDLSLGARQPDQPDAFRLYVSLSLGSRRMRLEGDWLRVDLRALTLRLEAPDHLRAERLTGPGITQQGLSWRIADPAGGALSGTPPGMGEDDALVSLRPRESVAEQAAPTVHAYIVGPEDLVVRFVRGDATPELPRANEAVIEALARKDAEADPNGTWIGSSWIIWKDIA